MSIFAVQEKDNVKTQDMMQNITFKYVLFYC